MGSVEYIQPQQRGDAEVNEIWEKRQAMTLAVQLPEDQQAALRIIEHMRKLYTCYLRPCTKPAAPVS